MLWFPAKVILLTIWVLLGLLFVSIFLIGHDSSRPMSAWRHCCVKTTLIIGTRIILLTCFVWLDTKYIDCNYSDYLGPMYRDDFKPIKRVSTIVGNHVSYFDVICLIASDL